VSIVLYSVSSGCVVAGRDVGVASLCRSVHLAMMAQVLSVDERLAALSACKASLSSVRATDVRLHVEVARKRLAAERADNSASVLTPVISTLTRCLDLFTALPTLV